MFVLKYKGQKYCKVAEKNVLELKIKCPAREGSKLLPSVGRIRNRISIGRGPNCYLPWVGSISIFSVILNCKAVFSFCVPICLSVFYSSGRSRI